MFCRHGRREDRCLVCRKEKRAKAAARKPVSTGKITSARRTASSRGASRSAASGALHARRSGASGVKVTKVARHAGDGWQNELVPGIHSRREARDLLAHLSRARVRLDRLTTDPPGPYATVRALAGGEAADREQAAWLLFQIAYYGPLETDAPFAEIDRLAVRWDDPLPAAAALEQAAVGPRGAHAADRGTATLAAYREWAARSGGQIVGLTGHATDPARRFDAAYRALALPGLTRAARYEFVVTLGRFGLVDVAPWSLLVDAGSDPVAVAAKRAFLTGDAVLLQRRLGALARELDLPVAAFDLGLRNWDLRPGPGAPLGHLVAGVPADPDPDELSLLVHALGLPEEEDADAAA